MQLAVLCWQGKLSEANIQDGPVQSSADNAHGWMAQAFSL